MSWFTKGKWNPIGMVAKAPGAVKGLIQNEWNKPQPAARPASDVPRTGAGGPMGGQGQGGQYGSSMFDPTYQAPGIAPKSSPYGSSMFDPTYMNPQGGTYSAARPAAAQAPGVLTTPGAYEQWYGQNKGELGAKGYLEQLYESGNQGANPWYDRERDKRQKRLEDQMSAMGVFGSGATARGMFELESELGAQQARDMEGLAGRADQQRGQRLDRAGAAAGGAQDYFQNRERMPLQDSQGLARDLSGLVSRYSTATADEQAAIKGEIIQSLIASGKIEADEAEGMAEAIVQGQGNAIKLMGMFGKMPVDFNPLFAPAPQSGLARGNKFLGDAIDAVMERRARMEQAQMQIDAQARENAAQRKLMGGYYDQQGELARSQQKELGRHNAELEARGKEAADLARAEAESKAYERSLVPATKGFGNLSESIVRPFLGRRSVNPFQGAAAPATGGAPAAVPPSPPPPPPPPVNLPAAVSGPGIAPPSQPPMDTPYTGAPGSPPGGAAPAPALPSLPAVVAGAGPAGAGAEPTSGMDWASMGPAARAVKMRKYFATLPITEKRITDMVQEAEAAIAAGVVDPDKAYSETIGAERNRISGEKRAAIGSRAGKTALTPSEEARYAALGNQILQGATARTEYVQARADFRAVGKMLQDFTSGNPAQQKVAAGLWAKGAAGPGVVDQKERHEFVNSIGGIDETFKKKILEWLGDGEIPEDQLGFFIKAIQNFEIPRQQKRLQNIHGVVGRAFEKHPNAEIRNLKDWALGQIELGDVPGMPATDQDIDDLIGGP